MKVGLVTNRFPILSETFIYHQAAGLEAAGLDVVVVTTMPSDDPYFRDDAALFAQLGGPAFRGEVREVVIGRTAAHAIHRTASRLLAGGARDATLWNAARKRYGASRRAVRSWLLALSFADFDVVHFEYSGLAIAYLDALALLAPARIVVSCRGTAERITPLLEPGRASELREMFARVDRVHCVSEDMLRTCESYGLDRAKAFVNRPAIDATLFRRASPAPARTEGPYRLLSTGRLIWAKGYEFALLAVRGLADRGVDVHYEIIGSGPEEERLRFAVHDLGLSRHVTLAGRRAPHEVRAALERADVYVLASVSEGISNAALEAMAMEVPVVSTTAGGMSEAIRDGVDGLLVPPRAPAALADAIAVLLADPVRRAAVGAAARKRIESEFTLARQIAAFVAAYEAA